MLLSLMGVVAFAQNDLVAPPATAQVETWYTTDGKYMLNTPTGVQDFTTVMSSVNVAIDGTDIYIQGLSYFFKDGWIKGTISGSTASFPDGQLIGEDDYGPEYICGTDDVKTLVENIVFNYDAAEGKLESASASDLPKRASTSSMAVRSWLSK